MRRKTLSGRFWARLSSLTCLVAASESWIAMASLAPVVYPLQREDLRYVLIHQLGQAHRVEQPAEPPGSSGQAGEVNSAASGDSRARACSSSQSRSAPPPPAPLARA